jgi:hypothetical protein
MRHTSALSKRYAEATRARPATPFEREITALFADGEARRKTGRFRDNSPRCDSADFSFASICG